MEKTTKKNRINYPAKKLIQSLFLEKLRSVIVLCYENERPLQGLAAEVDWHFLGYLSKQIKNGIITGRSGECTLIPLKKGNELFYIYILGGGHLTQDRKSPNFNIKKLTQNISSMKMNTIGISKSDFQDSDIRLIESSLSSNGTLWVFQ